MTCFLDLANEIIYKICIFTNCEDVKTFSAVNRRLNQVAKPIIDKHRLLWKKFEILEDGPETGFWFWHNLTRSLLSGSPGAPYIRHIKTGSLVRLDERNRAIGDVVKDWDVATDSQTTMILQRTDAAGVLSRRNHPYGLYGCRDDTIFDLFYEAIKRCSWIADDQERRDFRAALHVGDRSCIRALLLPLLPNLRTLKIEASSSASSQPGLEAAVKHAAFAYSLNQRGLSFGKLMSVDLTVEDSSDPNDHNVGGEYSLDSLASLMALPSMKKIAASIVRAEIFTRPPSLPPSNVTDITFLDQDISPVAFANLLKGGAPLVALHVEVSGGAQYFDEGGFGEVLLQNARHSLHKLELLRNTVNGVMKGIELQSFEKLEQLNISYECFCLGSGRTMADALPRSVRKFILRAVRYKRRFQNNFLRS